MLPQLLEWSQPCHLSELCSVIDQPACAFYITIGDEDTILDSPNQALSKIILLPKSELLPCKSV